MPGLLVVHINAQQFPEQESQILRVSIRVVVWPGVSHHKVKETIPPELQAAAAVILGYARDLQNHARWFAGAVY